MGRISFDSTRQLIALSLEVSSINADSVQAFSVTLDTGASITTIPSQVAIDLGYDLSNPKQEVDILASSGIFTAKIITVRKLTAIGETVENIDVLYPINGICSARSPCLAMLTAIRKLLITLIWYYAMTYLKIQ